MTKPIENLAQLRERVRSLKEKKSELQIQLRSDFVELKEHLRPGNLLLDSISGFTGLKLEPEKLLKNNFTEGLKTLIVEIIEKAGRKIEEKTHDFVEHAFDRMNGFIEKVFGKK